jgi:capsular exopolysaccharide synthesis family protein
MTDKPSLITLSDPSGAAAQAYGTLLASLTYAALDEPLDTLVITSPASGGSKSAVLANLGVTMARSGRKTILVDTDLRRPSLAGLFRVTDERGLSRAIASSGPLDSSLLVDLGVDGLKLLPSGMSPSNPVDVLSSRRMEEIIAALKQQAGVVLFDAPPVVPVRDAAVLGSRVDGVILVIEARETGRDEAERAKEILEQVGVRVVGTVLHNTRRDVKLGGY